MTATARPARTRSRGRRPRRGRRRALVVVAVVGGLLAAFAIGVALGRAIEENRTPADDSTIVRTLNPLPLTPKRVTVTVTSR